MQAGRQGKADTDLSSDSKQHDQKPPQQTELTDLTLRSRGRDDTPAVSEAGAHVHANEEDDPTAGRASPCRALPNSDQVSHPLLGFTVCCEGCVLWLLVG